MRFHFTFPCFAIIDQIIVDDIKGGELSINIIYILVKKQSSLKLCKVPDLKLLLREIQNSMMVALIYLFWIAVCRTPQIFKNRTCRLSSGVSAILRNLCDIELY